MAGKDRVGSQGGLRAQSGKFNAENAQSGAAQKPTSPPIETESENEADSLGPRTAGGPLGISLPPEPSVWRETRKLAIDKNVKVEDLATVTAQDPALVIDLLRVANAMYFSAGRPPITTAQTAIVRLGSDVFVETLEKLSERTQIEDEEQHKWFELHRTRCRRNSIICRILAEGIVKTLSDECQTAGLLMYVGEMVAVAYLQEKYIQITEKHPKSVNFRLAQDHKFDTERIGIEYLRRNGIPENLLFALDRDAVTRAPDRALMKPVCFAASEMLSAFDSERWDKLAPGKTIPPKSSIRMLQMTESQYLKVYERVSEFLFTYKLLEDKKKGIAPPEEAPPAVITTTPVSEEEQDSLETEIDDLIKGKADEEEEAENPPPVKTTKIREVASKIPSEELQTQFQLNAGPKKTEARVKEFKVVKSPKALRTEAANQMVTAVAGLFTETKTSEELLAKLLDKLIKEGPFEKTALIVVSQDRKTALVVAARGPKISNGQRLTLDDPLNPLAACFSKVQSFGNLGSKVSPFGSRAFAVSPIDADHETPVALYADCGENGCLTFEARRIFRTVVEMLNEKLPQLPGGIPVEVV